ncbi:membrane protein [Trabulsiella odontotermitis]|uniref:Membrane protein n=1 Tax=Trabulsiella odontotermitis TaxID=379893 RepID=A0A0L0GI66_9ENTR|nr:membrane protein [Trabulsiella odontotermitis]KNC93500.1 membrane protein [Trabulsiella odontotermitis]
MGCLIFLVLGGALSYHYNFQVEKIYKPERCSAPVRIYFGNVRANLVLDFMYSTKNHTGVVSVSGNYSENNKVVGTLRREVAYTWTENKNEVRLHSLSINKMLNDETLPDEIMDDILPDFYVYPDKNITYSILPQDKKGFLFTVGQRPIFFCAH